jgi:hypothetical protein
VSSTINTTPRGARSPIASEHPALATSQPSSSSSETRRELEIAGTRMILLAMPRKRGDGT